MKGPQEDVHQLAAQAIRCNAGSAPISDVIDYILSKKVYRGKTPRKTVNSILQRSNVIIVSNGICRLRSGA